MFRLTWDTHFLHHFQSNFLAYINKFHLLPSGYFSIVILLLASVICNVSEYLAIKSSLCWALCNNAPILWQTDSWFYAQRPSDFYECSAVLPRPPISFLFAYCQWSRRKEWWIQEMVSAFYYRFNSVEPFNTIAAQWFDWFYWRTVQNGNTAPLNWHIVSAMFMAACSRVFDVDFIPVAKHVGVTGNSTWCVYAWLEVGVTFLGELCLIDIDYRSILLSKWIVPIKVVYSLHNFPICSMQLIPYRDLP